MRIGAVSQDPIKYAVGRSSAGSLFLVLNQTAPPDASDIANYYVPNCLRISLVIVKCREVVKLQPQDYCGDET